jgi:hypothetical protein
MTYRTLVLLVALLLTTFIFAQNNQSFSIGVESNSQYYIDDEYTDHGEIVGKFNEENRFRSNNYIKLDYGIKDFSFGLQLEAYAPQALLNYSPNFDSQINIGTYFASYSRKKWGVTLGYFYEQFGSGLLLRTWEDRQLGINNSIRGAKLTFKPSEKIAITALFGNQRVGFKVSDGKIAGLDSNFDISSLFSNEDTSLQLGLSYLGRCEPVVTNNPDFNKLTHAASGRIQFVKGNFYADIESVLKDKDAYVKDGLIKDDKLFYGNAFLLNMGYSKKGFGLTGTFRRLENMIAFSDRDAAGNTYNEQVLNYLPSLTKQHDYSLSNIYVYQSQAGLSFNPLLKAGEIGGQIDIYYKLKRKTVLGGKYGTKLAFNFSNWNGLGAKYNTEYERVQVGLLDFGKRYYTDINFEIRKKVSKKLSGIAMFSNLYYNKQYIEETSSDGGEVRANIVVTEATYKLASKKSVRIEAQHLWTKDDKQNWMAGTAEFNLNSHFSIYAADMYNYGNEHQNERNHFYNFGGSYTKNKSRFALSYGRQRGGLFCVGGVCRIVPAATGFSFSLNTSF